jgi:hypothetical protein
MGSAPWRTSAAITASSSPGTGHTFNQWPQLAEELAHAVRTHSAVLDGEVCCLNPDRSNFKQLLFRHEWPSTTRSTCSTERI